MHKNRIKIVWGAKNFTNTWVLFGLEILWSLFVIIRYFLKVENIPRTSLVSSWGIPFLSSFLVRNWKPRKIRHVLGISMINIGISMISILMIYIYQKFWLNAGWISTWVENDLGGFCLGGKWLKVRVDFSEWKTAGGKRLSGFWMGGFCLQGSWWECHIVMGRVPKTRV